MPWLDIMGVDAVSPARWERTDGRTAVAALEGALERAGLPGALEAPKRLLDRSEALAERAREAKAAAQRRLEEANRGLLNGSLDVGGFGQELIEVGPWLDEEFAGMRGAMGAAAQIQGNAVQTVFAMAPGLYAALQEVCSGVVAEAAAVPELPQAVWGATSAARAAEQAIRANCEDAWVRLVRCGIQWDSIHEAAQLLRETGTLQGQLIFSVPTSLGVTFLNPRAALDGLDEVRRMPAPLRLRAAINRNWLPGLYLKSDHDAYAAEPKARRRLFAGKPSAPVVEFA